MLRRMLKRSKWKMAAFATIILAVVGLLSAPSVGTQGEVLANGGCHCGH